ncbi:MAG: class I SAM-dependent methyltransferase [Oligoflexia bacterium]|nr:class I SAM-dependent methyltransferase [Oligoflexia bacterium]
MRFLPWALMFCALQVPAAHSADGDCVREFASLQRKLRWNLFATDRSLGEYSSRFGPRFRPFLESLRAEDRWLDAGTGEARALREYQEAREAAGDASASLVGVALRAPLLARAKLARLTKRSGGRFRYLEGRELESIPAEELGPSRLITDFFGPLAYSSRPEAVLERYLEALAPGGRIYAETGLSSTVRVGGAEGERVLSLASWIGELLPPEQFRVSVLGGQLEIERLKAGAAFRLPRLKLLELSAEAPPARLFQVCGPGESC